MQTQLQPKYPRAWEIAQEIWHDVWVSDKLPSFDVALQKCFKKNPRFGSKDRKFYREAVFSAARKLVGYCDRESGFLGTQDNFVTLKNFARQKSIKSIVEHSNPAVDIKNFSLDSLEKFLPMFGVLPQFKSMLRKRIQMSQWTDEMALKFLESLLAKSPRWGYTIPLLNSFSLTEEKSEKPKNSEMQDLACQRIVKKIATLPFSTLWDACAGAGGKTLPLAVSKPQAKIYASDIRPEVLIELEKRFAAHRRKRILSFPIDMTSLVALQSHATIKKKFDLIVLDVPCSGSGTWRRNPENQFRYSLSEIQGIAEKQNTILENAAQFLCDKGHIAYVTCSWIVDENENVIEKFLQKHPDFSVVHQELYGSPKENADTLFLSILQKN